MSKYESLKVNEERVIWYNIKDSTELLKSLSFLENFHSKWNNRTKSYVFETVKSYVNYTVY